MLRLILNSPERLIGWAQEVIGCTFFPDARAIGWGDDDVIRAVAVYDRWSVADVHVHIASDGSGRWLTRSFMAAGFHFPFVTAQRRRVTGLVAACNHAALQLNLHAGFRREGVLREAAPDGGDVIVLGMLRRECRFLPPDQRGD